LETDRLEIELDQMVLDKENPRIGLVLTQSDALSAVVQLDVRHFRTMMQSIKDNGLDPGDSFYVIDDEEDGEYIVVDGNRRLAAIQVLSNPTVLKGTNLPESVTSSLIKITENFEQRLVASLRCVRFQDRSDANEWVLRRPGRGMEGEGRIAWGTLEIQRFQKDRTILDVIDFVGNNSIFSNDEWKSIKDKVERNTSTLRRLIYSKSGLEHFGISVIDHADGSKTPQFSKPSAWVLDILTSLFSDIAAEKVNTRSHNKASEISEYFRNIPAGKASTEPVEAKSFASAVIADSVDRPRRVRSAIAPIKVKTSKPPAIRATLAPNKHPFAQPKDEKAIQLLREASITRLKETPLACSFILRAFLQQAIDWYMTENNIPFWDNNKQLDLAVRAERVTDHLIANRKVLAKNLAGIKRTLAKGSDPGSIKALNDYHHDKYQVPAADFLRTAWDSSVGLFVAIYGAA